MHKRKLATKMAAVFVNIDFICPTIAATAGGGNCQFIQGSAPVTIDSLVVRRAGANELFCRIIAGD
jgi:radical SAM superfamily enzyme